MEIKGKITIFPERRQITLEDGTQKEIVQVKGTISNKDGEAYKNKSVLVKFSGKQFPEEKLNQLKDTECYSLEVEKGFLGVEIYDTKHGERRDLSLIVLEGKLTGHKPVEKREFPKEAPVDSDLPF